MKVDTIPMLQWVYCALGVTMLIFLFVLIITLYNNHIRFSIVAARLSSLFKITCISRDISKHSSEYIITTNIINLAHVYCFEILQKTLLLQQPSFSQYSLLFNKLARKKSHIKLEVLLNTIDRICKTTQLKINCKHFILPRIQLLSIKVARKERGKKSDTNAKSRI